MKKILSLFALSLTCMTINAQSMDHTLTPRRQGLAVIAALEAKGDQSALEKAIPEALDKGLSISEAKEAHLFGDIFARNNLDFADREIVTVSAISALPGCEPQLIAHVSGARNMGVTDEELRALPALLEEKVGAAEAERLRRALSAVLGDAHTPVRTVDFSVWPQGVLNPYGQYFTGNSYLAQLDGGLANVTFEPGCRNNWHVHHKAVQVLICVAGRGWYQEWGKPAVPMTPGTVIAIPAETKHWHGAAKDSWFQHLTYHTDMQEGSSNEWLEAVSDEQYDSVER